MGIIKFTLFFFIFLVLKIFLLRGSEIESRLDDNEFITRVIYREADYSFCLITDSDQDRSDIDLDFSFESRLIRAGRVKKEGFWREIFNPLKVSAGSDLFREYPGLGKDYSLYAGGLHGLSLGTEKGSSINVLFADGFWIGGNYSIGSDHLSVTALVSITENVETPSDDWTSDFPIVPVSNPIHMGLQSIFSWNNFKLDYLGVLSGNNIYKAGSYNRMHIELLWKKIKIKGFTGITTPDFITANVNLSKDKYLLSLWIGIYPVKYWETIIKTQYSEEHPPVLAAAFLPGSGSSSIKIKYDNLNFLISTEFGQQFNFNSDGEGTVENKFDTGIGVSRLLSLFSGIGFTSDFDSLSERRLELELKCSLGKTDVELVYKYKEEIFEPIDQHTFWVRVNQEFSGGTAFCKVEVKEGWLLEGLTVGFITIFG